VGDKGERKGKGKDCPRPKKDKDALGPPLVMINSVAK